MPQTRSQTRSSKKSAEQSSSTSGSAGPVEPIKKKKAKKVAPLPFVVEDPLPKMNIRPYTTTSLVVYGSETRVYKDNLKTYGCRYNAHLRMGPAWLIRADNEDGINQVKELIEKINRGDASLALILPYQVIRASMVYSVPKVGSKVRFEDGTESVVKAVVSEGRYPIYVVLEDSVRYVRGIGGWIRDTSMEPHGRIFVGQE